MSLIGLTNITKPAVEPVSVLEVRTYSRIMGVAEDLNIARWIRSARIKAENYQRRSYITQRWRMTFNTFPLGAIKLLRGPIQSLEQVKVVDSLAGTTIINNNEFLVDLDTGSITFKDGYTWPVLNNKTLVALTIDYKAGYGDDATAVPAYVSDAIMIYCAYRNENRLGETDVIPRIFFQILDEERLFSGLEE